MAARAQQPDRVRRVGFLHALAENDRPGPPRYPTLRGAWQRRLARFEVANKAFGSSICIGPVAASRCDQSLLRPLGEMTIRGRDDAIAVFEPWNSDVSMAWRQTYLGTILSRSRMRAKGPYRNT
jgi:hypothetical protein